MKRTVIAYAILAATLIFTGCNDITNTAQRTDTKNNTNNNNDNTDNNPPGIDDGVHITDTSIPYTEMIQVNTTEVTIQGKGLEGAFINNRTVALSPYSIGKYEVSRRLYMEVMSRMYDDLQANGYQFANPVSDTEENAKGKKAAAFVEFLGGKEVKVRTAGKDRYGNGPGDYLGNNNFSQPDYFDPQNLDLPMGGLQWHDAIIFTNYLSLISGRKPYYILDSYLAIQYQGMTMDKSKWGKKFGDEGENLYLYDSTSEKSNRTTDRKSDEARRNPVSWLLAKNWRTPYTGTGEADLLALIPPVARTTTYTLENVLTNQRISIDANADGYRLPTEAEWEYAARGGDPMIPDWNFIYAGSNYAARVANTSGKPVSVSGEGYKANSLGIYHMSGNVSEWVWDFKGFDDNGAASKNPTWKMKRISKASGVEKNPISQKGDLAAPSEAWVYMNQNAWRPADRIQRGGSYRDNSVINRSGEITITSRMGRTKNYSRDGFARYWENMHNGVATLIYGNATQNAPKAVLDSGLRLASSGIQEKSAQ